MVCLRQCRQTGSGINLLRLLLQVAALPSIAMAETNLTRRMLLFYRPTVPPERCGPHFTGIMKEAIAYAASNATGDVYNSSMVELYTTGCDGWTPPPGSPTLVLEPPALEQVFRRLRPEHKVICDWTIECPAQEARARLLDATIEPSDASDNFKRQYVAYFTDRINVTFFKHGEDDIWLQKSDGCLGDTYQCPYRSMVLHREASRGCLFPHDILFPTVAACVTDVNWSWLLMFVGSMVVLFIVMFGLSRRQRLFRSCFPAR